MVRRSSFGHRGVDYGAVFKMTLTHEKLCQLLSYDPASGVFRWRVAAARGKYRSGSIAGHTDASGYCKIMVEGRRYYAHRLAWFYCFKTWPQKNIDHKDRCRHNNRIANLRDVGQSENGLNSSLRRNNSSGCTGVSYDPRRNVWVAYITLGRAKKHLGAFANMTLACAARKRAEDNLTLPHGK